MNQSQLGQKYQAIQTRVENHILYIVLNRPDVHNAFNTMMIEELATAFRLDACAPGLRAVVLTANGKSFCAGADLHYMKSMAKFSHGENVRDAEGLYEMFDSGRNIPVPVIGKVFGHVMGGGLGLTAICDMVAGHKDTQFAFSEARLGLVPSVISSFILEKVPFGMANELMLTAETFSAARAREIGLLHFVGELEEVDDYLQSKIDIFLSCGPEAVRETKKLLKYVNGNRDRLDIQNRTTTVIAERRGSAEAQEGLSAFFEKKKPSWKLK